MASNRTNQETKRAAAAWEKISTVKQNEASDFRDQYRTLAQKFPTVVQTNGIGQALAFLRAKGKGDNAKAHQRFYNDVAEWVISSFNQFQTGDDLLHKLVQEEHGIIYRAVATEAMAYGRWLKRFAEAELKKDKAATAETES